MNTLYALLIFAMGILASWFLFDGMSRVQMQRETVMIEHPMKNGLKHCSIVGTGQHCWLEGNKELVVITAKGAGR
jgi:hypothetical protein